MKYPTLKVPSASRDMVSVFGGYDHNLKIAEGAFYDMTNMSSADYPMLSTRRPRGTVQQLEEPQGLIAKDALAIADKGKLYFNGAEVTGLTLADGEKQMVSMGAYLLIWPDKKFLNTKDLTDYGSMEAAFRSTGSVVYSLCMADGSALGTVHSTKPETPAGGDYWLDTTQEPHSLQVYSEATGYWTAVATVYTKISAVGIGAAFEEGDGVSISGVAYAGDSAVVKEQFEELNGTKVIFAKGDDYIVVVGLVDITYEQTAGSVSVRRTVPDMDFVCQAQNRIWGCKYGMVDGEVVNELYCCKLGDFRNWNVFLGISTDAWRGSVGSDGVWTGCINYLGYPTFFKENVIHRISVSSSGAHQVTETVGRGVQQGSGRSLCVVNEVLYYKGRTGVCAYDGSFPGSVGTVFGAERYGRAVAGGFGGRYYLSMQAADSKWHLFVYNTERGLWHREDNTHVMQFAAMDDDLFYIDADNGRLMCIEGTQGTKEDRVEWMAETGIIGYNYPDRKYLGRCNIQLSAEDRPSLRLEVKYDDHPWETLRGGGTVSGIQTLTIPVIPRRCDHFRLRLSGKGMVRIFSFTKILEVGSDL